MNKEALLSRIAEAEAQLDEMRKELNKKEVWEPEGGDWAVSSAGNIYRCPVNPSSKDFGMQRKTEAAAEKAHDEMRVFNRLLAYRDEFAPGYEPDWGNDMLYKYFVQYVHTSGEYSVNSVSFIDRTGAVYMPKDVAEELCRKLNSGEVVL